MLFSPLTYPQDYPHDFPEAAYSHSRCNLLCHESTDSHDNAKLQQQMLCYHLASPAQVLNPYVNAHHTSIRPTLGDV